MKLKYPVFAFSIIWFLIFALSIALAAILYESKLVTYSQVNLDETLFVACWSIFGVVFDIYLRWKQPMKLNFWGKPMIKTEKQQQH